MKKILAAIIALALIMPVAAEAGTNRHKKHRGNNYHSGQNYHDGNKNWHGKRYKYRHNNNHNNNNNFYNDPNFWWGAGAGLLGGSLLNQYNNPPPGYYVQGAQCQLWDPYSQQYVWAQGEICYR